MKQKSLTICNYNPRKTIVKILEYISKEIHIHSKYDNFLLISNFNSEPTEETMKKTMKV